MEKITRDTQLIDLADQGKLSIRALNCCKLTGIYTLGQLLDTPLVELKKIRNLGPNTLAELSNLCEEYKTTTHAEPAKEPFRVGNTIFIPCYRYDRNYNRSEFMLSLDSVVSIDKEDGEAMIRIKHEIDKFCDVFNCIYNYETLIEKLQQLK